jgi:nitrite reductase/ring-hydroxylating ferredoxin subunit
MNRKTFIKTSCLACTSIGFMSSILEGCAPTKYTTGTLQENGIMIPLKEFARQKKGQTVLREYVLVRHEDVQFPFCIYRLGDNTYSALLMRCTHQGAELQVSGDRLTCPAHGSEFDNRGKVLQSPAGEDLRRFPVSVIKDQLFIDLRKTT